ncbi:hypothetical protein [Pseudonocardia sp. GCM10023141]|uniref:hypothetical protein n=1 Tax=Pseudonocardia sp. GCM10023141 TaxID=3252653 RepID=UPI00361770F5
MQQDPTTTERPLLGLVPLGLIALTTVLLVGVASRLVAYDDLPFLSWVGVAALAAAMLLVIAPGRRWLFWARVLCVVVLIAAVSYVVQRLVVAADPASISERIGSYWSSLFPLTRPLYDAGGVGLHTPRTPGMLGQAALLLLLATIGTRPAPATV